MNPKAMGAATLVVVVVAIACFALLGGDESSDPFEVPRPTGSGALDGTQPGPTDVAIRTTPREDPPEDTVFDAGSGVSDPDRGGPAGSPRAGDPSQPADGEGRGRLRVLCQDGDGNPLAGVNVSARRASGAPLPSAISGGNGEAVIQGLPVGERVQGEARHALFRDTVSWGPVPVSQDGRVELLFEASPLGNLRGMIVDSKGQGLRDAELVLVDPKQQGESVLDPLAMGLGPDGSFWAEVAAGQYAVSARGPGFSPSDQTYVTIPQGGEVDVGTLVVQGKGSLAGSVTLPADLTAVLPVDLDLVVEVVTGSESNPVTRVQRHRLAIDANMRWELPEVDPGRIRLRLEVPQAGGNRVGGWEQVVLDPGQRVDKIDLGLQEVMVAIQGMVRDDQSQPLEGAEVRCGSRRVNTDRDGRYSLRGLDLGDVFVEVHHEGHGVGFKKISYLGSTVQADFELPRAGGVRGYVRTADGEPASNVPVQVVERQEDGGVRPHETSTDGGGFYEVLGLAPGDYYVKAGPGNPWEDSGAPSLTLTAGEVVEVPELILR